MGFRTGSYARTWEVQPVKDTLTKINISISKKDKGTGEYVKDFSGWVACIGTAAATKAMSLSEGDTIILGDIDVSNTYNKEKKVVYTDYKIFSFELADNSSGGKGGTNKSAKSAKNKGYSRNSVDSGEIDNEVESDSRLPF